jgi:hypothetical protein
MQSGTSYHNWLEYLLETTDFKKKMESVDKINKEEAAEFLGYLTTHIDNKGKQLSGKPNLVEFIRILSESRRHPEL